MDRKMSNIREFLHDDTKENLVVYEIELHSLDDPNEELRAHAKSQGDCPCRLWFVVLMINIAVLAIIIFLILLLLIEIGPVPPYQTYGKQCVSANCDSTKGLVCAASGQTKTCQCPTGNWFWYNQAKCLECPPNWLVGNNGAGCYFTSYIRLNFTDANLWCQASQSRLAEISSDSLFAALQSTSQLNLRVNNSYWVGLRETGPNQNVYKCVTSGSTCSNSNYFCSGYPAHAYNYYFQQYDQCLGLYIQSSTSTCLRDSTCPDVAAFICELY